jgi:hypothetical protein
VVSSKSKAEWRWGLGVASFVLTLGAVYVVTAFPGSVEATDATYVGIVAFVLLALFFWLIYPRGRAGGFGEGQRKRSR